MPYLVAILLFAIALSISGCKGGGGAGASINATNSTARSARTMTATTIGNDTNKPAMRPVQLLNGRIVGTRPALRFVIIDFQNSRLPQLDQVLHVYRLDQKVAEVKISGPYMGSTVAADVIAGEAGDGDLVRDRPMPLPSTPSTSPGR